jgi:UDP-N-acetylglucosamine acyltransferase
MEGSHPAMKNPTMRSPESEAGIVRPAPRLSGGGVTIHPTAHVDPRAELGAGVEVGAGAVVGPQVRLGERVRIGPHVVLTGDLSIGADSRVFPGAVVGEEPQDFSYRGEPTSLEIGPRCVIRENATVNRGTAKGGGVTRIGADVLVMANAHVAHDCQIGEGAVLCNGALAAGHVEIGRAAFVSGNTALHQFVRIGRLAMIGGVSRVARDVPPFALLAGDSELRGVNGVGIRRKGVPRAAQIEIRAIYRLLFQTSPTYERGLVTTDEGRELLAFLEAPSRRGFSAFRARASSASNGRHPS